MGRISPHIASLAACVALVVAIQTARVVEIVSGHMPSHESDAVFGLAVAGLLALAGAGRTVKGS